MREEEVPDVGYDFLPDEAHQVCLEVIEHPLEEVKENDADRNHEEHRIILLEEYLIEHGLNEESGSSIGGRGKRHEDGCEKKLAPVRLNKSKKSQVEGHKSAPETG